ncbi:MAG TPA: FAD-dependent monooxygenase [Nodosilinea sp.]|nr:FAD-dependent monooxygenase [Nodosilinea sp.]
MSHAVVIGGSIAGLLAARVLLNHFDRVTLLERDRIPSSPGPRPGVPQAQHVHALLLRGHQILESLFPGLTTDLMAQGALRLDWTADWRFLTQWDWMPRHVSRLEGLICSRLLLEWYLRDRLLQRPGFQLQGATLATGLVAQGEPPWVTGVVWASDGQSQTLAADWVVDASGRNSKLADWLVDLGFQRPPATTVNSFLGYASRWYRRPAQAPLEGLIVAAKPGVTRRGGVLYPVEGDRCVITLSGIEKDYPSANEAEFWAFANSLRDPTIANIIQAWEPIAPIQCYRRTENHWRHYEKLPALPDGVVALGDAACAFNPIYGQGMTAAALGAVLLDSCLERSRQGPRRRGLALGFQKQLAKALMAPWLMATSEDLRWPMTTGDRPGWLSQQLQRYFDRVAQAANHDTQVHRAFIEVAHLTKPPTHLLHPRTVWKALT